MKKNYIILVLLLLIGISIGYAVINSTLLINGRSNIEKNTWDIHFNNVIVKEGSVEALKLPTIENSTTVDFEVQLDLPGDYYEFTVDVVNNGTIDAMIESIDKTPVLTEAQAKYLNYTITYENDETITIKQLVNKESFVRLKVKVELRKDIDPSDLPDVGDVLYLSFTVNYQQADNTGVNVKDNGVAFVKVVNGSINDVGSEVCIGEECFYVMYSDESSITMLSKYNLYVGGEYDGSTWVAYGDEATGKQDSSMRGYLSLDLNPKKGTIQFSNSVYWSSTVSTYPAYVYNKNSLLYSYVENYKTYLSVLGVTPIEARLISFEELSDLGCVSPGGCKSSLSSWVYATSYWTGSVYSSSSLLVMLSVGDLVTLPNVANNYLGVRPVIVISKDYF